MDTAQEKAIGLGADYPFEPLGAGECIVPQEYKALTGVSKGETIKIETSFKHLLNSMIDLYNAEYQPIFPIDTLSRDEATLKYECTVKDFIGSSYGKYA